MAQRLLKQFKVVMDLYDNLCDSMDTAYEALKFNQQENVKDLNFNMLMVNADLESEEKTLQNMIEEECEKYQIEAKITKLVEFYTVKEKEDVLYGFENIIRRHRDFQIKNMTYQRLADSKRQAGATIIEFWNHVAIEEGRGGSMFVNLKM